MEEALEITQPNFSFTDGETEAQRGEMTSPESQYVVANSPSQERSDRGDGGPAGEGITPRKVGGSRCWGKLAKGGRGSTKLDRPRVGGEEHPAESPGKPVTTELAGPEVGVRVRTPGAGEQQAGD